MKINCIKIFVALSVLAAVSSCNIYKPYRTPEMKTDDLYRAQPSTDTANIAQIPWQELFTDPCLRELIDSALANNFDYRAALLRVEQANAAFAQKTAAFFPTLNISGSETFTNIENQKSANFYNIAAVSSWELDVFGRLRSAKRAAKGALLQSIAYKRAVETQVVSSVANGYYTLLSLDEQLIIYDETIDLWTESLRTMESMMEAGAVNRAAVDQSRGNLYSLKASRQAILYNIRATENALRLLVGKPAGEIVRGKFEDQKLNIDLKIGLPSQLLANRPDVQMAEAGVRTAFANTNMARAAFYPSFTLTASGGYANDASVSFIPSFFGNFVAGLMQPIFNAGINRANLRVAKSQQEEALIAFRQALVNAGIEVSNTLYNYTTSVDKLAHRQMQVASMKDAMEATSLLFELNSGASYLEVLTAQQSLLSAQTSRIDDQLSQLQNVVNLYHALGGGWEKAQE